MVTSTILSLQLMKKVHWTMPSFHLVILWIKEVALDTFQLILKSKCNHFAIFGLIAARMNCSDKEQLVLIKYIFTPILKKFTEHEKLFWLFCHPSRTSHLSVFYTFSAILWDIFVVFIFIILLRLIKSLSQTKLSFCLLYDLTF